MREGLVCSHAVLVRAESERGIVVVKCKLPVWIMTRNYRRWWCRGSLDGPGDCVVVELLTLDIRMRAKFIM